MRFLVAALFCALAAIAPARAYAAGAPDIVDVATYPSKPIRMVVPWPAGGAADTLARTLAEYFQDVMKQRVIVENRPGGAGTTGTALVVKAAPDGYTLLVGAMDTHVINPTLYGKRVPFNGIDDFQPIDLLAYATIVLAVHPSVPARSVSELIALAKARAGQLRFNSAGEGSNTHLLTILLERGAAIRTLQIPHRGSVAAANDVAGGNADALFSSWAVIEPLARAGKLRPLAVTTRDKAPSLPNLPTLADTVPDLNLGIYYGLFAPRGTPSEIVQRLNRHSNAGLQQAGVRARLLEQGLESQRSTPEQFEKQLRDDYAYWAARLPQLQLDFETLPE